MNDRTDEIAREAALLLDTGRATGVTQAVRAAADALGYRDGPLPGPGRVRRHLQGRALEALGAEGYRATIHAVWQAAEELLTTIEHGVPGAGALLAGRAARGHVDGGVTLHVRAYTDEPIGVIAAVLVERGYEEPAFETAETRCGRLDRLRLFDGDLEILVTRCPAGAARSVERDRDLFTGRRIETADAEQLGAQLGRARAARSRRGERVDSP